MIWDGGIDGLFYTGCSASRACEGTMPLDTSWISIATGRCLASPE